MDFWARLVKGGSPSKKQVPPASASHVRVAQLKRAYNSLLQIWHNGDGVSEEAFVIKNVCICLQRLAELLREDQRSPTPHLCISFAATSRILVTVVRISTAFQTEPVAKESLRICQLLIDNEEEAFLEDKAFADALPGFVESTQRLARLDDDAEIEASLVEALFGITAKLKVDSHLLRVWFRRDKPEEEEEELTEDERKTSWEEFPLFYILLNYVPREGRAGEFSRMGLVYIVEMATASSDLEAWLVEGDVPALMASGLGALYSQLSRKLAIYYRPEEAPSILTFSERLNAPVAMDAEATVSDSYQSHLGTFLMSLRFWQDMIEHCHSEEVKHTLLDHFQYLFLQQLLYPSLIESSDVDGGSSVAVLTYLRHILEHIDHPDLVRVTLQYLFGLQRTVANSQMSSVSRARSRKSADLLTKLVDEDQPNPELFSLSALIFTSLGSKSQQTVTATLHILSAMLRGSYHQSLTSLLRTRPVLASDQKRTIGAHEKEIEKYLSLAEDLAGFQDLEKSYEQHVYDTRTNLETHPCSVKLLNLPVGGRTNTILDDGKMSFSPKVLVLEDATFTSLLALLDNFFKNDIETNLELTQVLVDLASCGFLRLENWLLSSPSSYTYPDQLDPILNDSQLQQEDSVAAELAPNQLKDIRFAKLPPRISPEHVSPIIQTLARLTKTVSSFRHSIPEFESQLMSCRNIVELQSTQATPISTPSRSPSRRPTATNTPLGKVERLSMPTPSSSTTPSKIAIPSTSSRGISPRGRQENQIPGLGTPPSLLSRLSQLQLSPTRKSFTPTSDSTPSRSPLRVSARTPIAQAVPAIPATLWRRIRVDKHTPERRDAGQDSSSSDSDSETSSISPSHDELSPGFSEPLSKHKHPAVPSRSKAEVTSHGSPSRQAHSRNRSSGSRSTAMGSDQEDQDTGSATLAKREHIQPSRRTNFVNDGTVSLGHLLSNVIILQEFALEIASIVEVRGALFEEVRFF